MDENKKETTTIITAFKGFDLDWKCRDFQFEVGKEYVHDGIVKACKSGFHACENPLDVFNYYAPATSKFAIVEQSGDISKEDNSDTKIASKKIKIKAEIDIPYLVKASIEYVTNKCDKAKSNFSDGDRSASSATGDQSASSATGDRSASSATGDQSASSVDGKNAVAMNIGVKGKAKASLGGAIVLCEHDDDYNLICIKSAIVGTGKGMPKPDTYYILENGKFKEVE
jgi:hypothetical protein